MGTPREDLLALLSEALYETRKSFGMYGQISVSIADVSPERLTVQIQAHRDVPGIEVAINVRNAILNWLPDLLPVKRFVAIYANPTLWIKEEVHDLPFSDALSGPDGLASSLILVDSVVSRARGEMRPKMEEAWDRLVEESR